MSTLQDLDANVTALETSSAARETRAVDRNTRMTAQIAALQQTITDLQALGGLTPEQQTLLDNAIVRMQAVVAAMDAADQTPAP